MASSQSPAVLRLSSDYKAISLEPLEGASASPKADDNLFLWQACIFGPPDTAWDGGVFNLTLIFTDNYPAAPPVVKFNTPVFHPNVYSDGTLCLDIIQDKWSPAYSVSTILTSVQSLFNDPNPNSPANPEAAKLYVTNKKEYNKKVRASVRRSMEMEE
mmetsp:Transcript_25622/g.39945  ORF Transcript_25622/g.39945 Transcript_25622/m.39945 type:complete len:158 (-) Transcript_25622:175-648(-)|eukprot:CAMPEP_0201516814 /NCGR_PEP_ID=MMETSP0161_2-20130828/8068_1 /ASSEMBLY_ACC=CAM_ASM_000251 /TAXON_ID=180227 /ORGANISM="Neoparamoeba aestuarina, Strain SoJaBio B1-5/56/2" /LENGTH=157 /DNA_ID=CAMNT_0047914097 /DNA_START=62 /DNA_END=535 /DNA_ORIENTATION=+